MSAVPHDENRLAPLQRGWQERRGLTFSQAEELLDQLEAAGVAQREAVIGPAGVCVRWRGEWPRLQRT